MRVVKRLGLLLCLVLGCDRLPELPPVDAGPQVAPTAASLLRSRGYKPLVPPTYDAGTAWPLILVLHGYGGTGTDTLASLRFDDLEPSAVLVAPNGLKDALGNNAWHPGAVHGPPWDVEWLTAVIKDVESRYTIDPTQVFVVGHSQGAHMAHRMGCDDANDVVALVSVAGQVTKVPSGCVPSKPVSVLQVHGDLDTSIGYYGDTQHDPPDPTVPTAHETVAVWARNDHCTGEIVSTGRTIDLANDLPGAETSVEAYEGCPAGSSVELWTMHDIGHNPVATSGFAPSLYGFLTSHPR